MNVIELKPQMPGMEIVTALIAISKTTRTIIALHLAALGLKNGEDEILIAMQNGEPTSADRLSVEVSVRYPTMLRAVDSLVDRGYLVRLSGPSVRISDRGNASLPAIASIRSTVAADLTFRLGKHRVGEIAKDLRDLGDSLSESLTRLS
ncbi:MAG: MarR family transcriptional regulator [Proteobacteria bacterium]|nr:MAG: MarR family transcriptional regulator [Pseudomonadota bacterium]